MESHGLHSMQTNQLSFCLPEAHSSLEYHPKNIEKSSHIEQLSPISAAEGSKSQADFPWHFSLSTSGEAALYSTLMIFIDLKSLSVPSSFINDLAVRR